MDAHDGAVSAGPAHGVEARQVEVSAIEDALTQLWMSSGGGARATMHTYVLNLIIFAGSRSDRAAIEAVAARVGALHPARTIILYTNPSSGSKLDAWVAAQVEYPGADERTGSEQITLEAAGESVRQLPGAIIPHLVPDIPVVLWWP